MYSSEQEEIAADMHSFPPSLNANRSEDASGLPGFAVVRETDDEVIDALLADLIIHARNCTRTFGDFHLAISAMPASEPALRRLMYDPNLRDFPWGRTHLWLTDDLDVPWEDERSRSRLVSELIVDHADLPREQFHPIVRPRDSSVRRGDAEVSEAYESEFRDVLAWREKGHDRPDFVFLTLGAQGRVGGLFPGGEAVCSQSRLFAMERGGPGIITITPMLINASRLVAVLATGEEARNSLRHLASCSPTDMPAAGIRPLGGELRWYLERSRDASGDAALAVSGDPVVGPVGGPVIGVA